MTVNFKIMILLMVGHSDYESQVLQT